MSKHFLGEASDETYEASDPFVERDTSLERRAAARQAMPQHRCEQDTHHLVGA